LHVNRQSASHMQTFIILYSLLSLILVLIHCARLKSVSTKTISNTDITYGNVCLLGLGYCTKRHPALSWVTESQAEYEREVITFPKGCYKHTQNTGLGTFWKTWNCKEQRSTRRAIWKISLKNQRVKRSWRKSDLAKGHEQNVRGRDFGISAVGLKQQKNFDGILSKEIILRAVRQIRERMIGWPNTGYNVGATARSSAVTRSHFRSSRVPSSRWQHRRLDALRTPYLAFSFPERRNVALLRYH